MIKEKVMRCVIKFIVETVFVSILVAGCSRIDASKSVMLPEEVEIGMSEGEVKEVLGNNGFTSIERLDSSILLSSDEPPGMAEVFVIDAIKVHLYTFSFNSDKELIAIGIMRVKETE